MALVNAYCTVEQLREQLGDGSDKLDVDLLERAINAASRAVDRWCARRFWQDAQTAVRTYRVDDPEMAWVDDISTTTGLVVRLDPLYDASWTVTLAAADYQLEPLNAAADGVAYAWWRIAAIGGVLLPVHHTRATLQVTARFGWSAVPIEVEQATLLKATSLFRRKDAPFGVAGFGEFGMVRISRYDPDVTDLLNPYRRVQLGAV